MAEHAHYFSDWRARTVSCACGWTGPHGELDSELFDELQQLSCPKCDAHLLLVSYPTGEDIQRAAEEGHEEAVRMLPQVLAREATQAEAEKRLSRWKREAVQRASDLPELQGDELAFHWDTARIDDDTYFVIKVGEQLVCREPAYIDRERFGQVKALLKERYGARFRRLDTSAHARDQMLDPDSISDVMKASFDPT
jgi:hypothetical protein